MFRVASEPEFRQVPVENVDDSSPVDFDEEGEDDASSDAALDVAVPVSFEIEAENRSIEIEAVSTTDKPSRSSLTAHAPAVAVQLCGVVSMSTSSHSQLPLNVS